MKPFSADEIGKIVNGTLIRGERDSIITRVLDDPDLMENPNTLFFLKKRTKKHWDAIKRCLPCVAVADKEFEEFNSIDGCTVILVNNVENAFWAFVEYYRGLFDIPVAAVTGTTGKTTTKDMIMHILSYYWDVVGTDKSGNTLAKNCRYLFGIEESTDAAVIETAVSHPGVLAHSCRMFKPTLGIITNIGIDHTEGCRNLEGYIKAKAEMLPGLGDNGVLLVNADDENTKKIGLESFKGRIVYFGVNNPAHFRGCDIRYGENGMKFILTYHHTKYRVYVPGLGGHQVYNTLAAIAAAHELGIGIRAAVGRLSTFEVMPRHLQLIHGINGSTIVDDTWNINPTSLKAAVNVLNNISKGRKKGLIVGDINELGDISAEIHRQAGDMIVDTGGVDILITIGKLASEIAKRAEERGMKGEIYTFPDINGIYELLKNKLNENTIILLKFSGLRDDSIVKLVRKLDASQKGK